MGCGVLYQQLREVEKALGAIRRAGIPESADPYRQLYKLRGQLMSQRVFKMPRSVTQLVRIAGLSPGILTLFHDTETGFLVEARSRPGAPPVYHHVDEVIAEDILAGRDVHGYMARFEVYQESVDN